MELECLEDKRREDEYEAREDKDSSAVNGRTPVNSQDLTIIATFLLKVLLTAAAFWTSSVPLCAIAFKLRQGNPPVPFEWGEYIWRSAVAALGMTFLAGLVLVILQLDPSLQVLQILLILFVPFGVGAWIMSWADALDDWIAGLSVFAIYACLPYAVLVILALVAGGLSNVMK